MGKAIGLRCMRSIGMSMGRVERIEVLDATTGVVLDTRTGANFGGGQYWVWDIAGRVRFRITNTGPGNAVLSGVFIDASN